MKTDDLGIQHKTFEDYLMSPSAQGEAYDRARAGKWKQREIITYEEQAQICKIET